MNTLSELDSLKVFFEENNISLTEAQFLERKHIVRFIIPTIKFFLNEKKDIAEGAEFELVFYPKNKNKIPELYVVGINQPFHPHFKNVLLKGRTKWVDYKEDNITESVIDFLKRVFLSLQFHSGYVCRNENFANKKAQEWYLLEKHQNPDTFPTGNFLKKKFDNVGIIRNTKKFDIQENNTNSSKKFEIKEPKSESKKKFEIKETHIGYSPIEQKYVSIDTIKSLNALSNEVNDKFRIYITEEARQQLLTHIDWGNNTHFNRNEQGGILVGNVCIDKKQNIQYAIVSQAIAGTSAKGSSAYLEIGHEVWKDMIDKVDVFLENNPDKHVQIIGWYHTHPGSLDVFMSGTDRNTQQLYFNQDWHYAIVLNPQKQIWKAFYGKNAQECSGFFIQNQETPLLQNENENGKESENLDSSTNTTEGITTNSEESKTNDVTNRKKKRKQGIIMLFAFSLLLIGLIVIFAKFYQEEDLIIQIAEERSEETTEKKEKSELASKINHIEDVINVGDAFFIPKNTIIYSDKEVISGIVQNRFKIIISHFDSIYAEFNIKLYVGNYHSKILTDSTKLYNNALLKTQKIPKNWTSEAASIFISINNENRAFRIIEKDSSGWLKIEYRGLVKKKDLE